MNPKKFILMFTQSFQNKNLKAKMSDDGKDYDDGKEKVKEFDWMPTGCVPLADGEYDAIILGTGLTECIISGLLSVQGKRVLHLDRNNYYGADTASLSLNNLFQKFRQSPPTPNLGSARGFKFFLLRNMFYMFHV
jgi:hypothetical protein